MSCNSLQPNGFPYPPANLTAMSAFRFSENDLRWDDPATLDAVPSSGGGQTEPTPASLSVVVNGVPSAGEKAQGYIQVVNAPIPVGSLVAIDGLVLTAVSGHAGEDEFDGSSTSNDVVASNLMSAINAGSPGKWGSVTATVVASRVFLQAGQTGEGGNEISLYTDYEGIYLSGETLLGGATQATITVNGVTLSCVTEERGFGTFNPSGASLAEAINDPVNDIRGLEAVWNGVSLSVRSTRVGAEGNRIPVVSNCSSLVVSYPTTTGGTGSYCPPGMSNRGWNIFGVNVYRSDTGERGPYFRVNRVPIMSNFYRDRTDIAEVIEEIVPWNGGWIFKGDAPNNKWAYRIRTRYRPLLKKVGDTVTANAPTDVSVYINGVQVAVGAVFGPTGEIDLSMESVWNPTTEKWDNPVVPNENSIVTVTYNYLKGEALRSTLQSRAKIFYRVTTVAQDTTGTSPSGLIETPLDYCPPVSPEESEKLDYIWREAIRRNRFILEQGGERVKLFLRRTVGNPCPCKWDPRLFEFSKQPLNNCLVCYGSGFIGGYEGPYDIIIPPEDNENRVSQGVTGRRVENTYEVWIGPSPVVSQRDFIVKQNGDRFSIGPVRTTQIRGLTLQQTFQIGYLDTTDIRYRVPMGALERLPWPQTRFTNPEDAACVESAPYPIGADYQATPMGTEAAKVPDGREQRGRTPVWQNLTYGGKGR